MSVWLAYVMWELGKWYLRIPREIDSAMVVYRQFYVSPAECSDTRKQHGRTMYGQPMMWYTFVSNVVFLLLWLLNSSLWTVYYSLRSVGWHCSVRGWKENTTTIQWDINILAWTISMLLRSIIPRIFIIVASWRVCVIKQRVPFIEDFHTEEVCPAVQLGMMVSAPITGVRYSGVRCSGVRLYPGVFFVNKGWGGGGGGGEGAY